MNVFLFSARFELSLLIFLQKVGKSILIMPPKLTVKESKERDRLRKAIAKESETEEQREQRRERERNSTAKFRA